MFNNEITFTKLLHEESTIHSGLLSTSTNWLGVSLLKELKQKCAAAFNNEAVKWFTVALLVRIAAAIAIHLYSLSHGYGGFYPLDSGHDDVRYWNNAIKILQGSSIKLPNDYPWLLAGLFYITGPSLIAGKMLNVLFGALSVYFGVVLARELANKFNDPDRAAKAARWTGVLLTFYPAGVFYSTQLLKDTAFILLAILAIYLMHRFTVTTSLAKFGCGVLWLLALYCLWGFRFYAAVALVFAMAAYGIMLKRKVFVFLSLAIIFLIILWGNGLLGGNYIGQHFNNIINWIKDLRESTYSIGGSAAGIAIDYNNPGGFLLTFFYSLVTLLLGPFPWQLYSPVHYVAVPEAVILWLLSPLWILGLIDVCKGLLRNSLGKESIPVVFALALAGGMALFSDNVGVNTRLRLLPWTVIIISTSHYLPYLVGLVFRKDVKVAGQFQR